jgi:phage shock protein PspC (stress-responsive transcriptional regulator)
LDTVKIDGVHTKELVKIQFTTMTRSKTDRIVAGVCGGIAKSTGINPWLFRILFLLIGGGFWVYLLMWAFIEEDNY